MPISPTANSPQPPSPGFQGWLRLALAVLLTAALPPCWLMLFAARMNIPLKNPTWVFILALLAIAVLIPVLCRGLLSRPKRRRLIGTFSFAIYVAMIVSILWVYSGPLLPFWQVCLVLGTGSLWAYGIAWFYALIPSWTLRIPFLAVVLIWGWALPHVIRFDGLTGDARANFAWTKNAPREFRSTQSPPSVAQQSPPQKIKPDPLDFPEFLGNRQAVLPARPLTTDWNKSPPEKIWTKPVGTGWSSFALVGDLGVTLEQRAEQECIVCYRLSTGEELWVHQDPTRFHGVLGGDGPRSTPTIDENRVYAVGGTGILTCLDLATGKKLWGLDVMADNGGKAIHHGLCGSPLIVDRMVIVSPTGSAGISLVAYDKLTGRRFWRSGKWPATYSSPMLATLRGTRQILVYNNKGVESHSIKDGKLLWDYEWTNTESTICSQPVLIPGKDNQILLSIGYAKGSTLIEIDGEPDGPWSAKPVWTSKELKTKFTTAVIHNGFIYGLDDGILECVDLTNGKRLWKKGRYQHGQILLVGDLLLIQAESGELVLVHPDPRELREIARIPALNGKTWNNPALGREYLLVRNDQEAICFRMSSTPSPPTATPQ